MAFQYRQKSNEILMLLVPCHGSVHNDRIPDLIQIKDPHKLCLKLKKIKCVLSNHLNSIGLIGCRMSAIFYVGSGDPNTLFLRLQYMSWIIQKSLSYLGTQIERFTAQILEEEAGRSEEDASKLSPQEFAFAKE